MACLVVAHSDSNLASFRLEFLIGELDFLTVTLVLVFFFHAVLPAEAELSNILSGLDRRWISILGQVEFNEDRVTLHMYV